METDTSLVAGFARTPARLAEAISGGGLGSEAPPDGSWGPPDIVRHLIAVEVEVHQSRLRDLIVEAEPRWSWTEPGPWPGEPGATLERLLDLFAVRRRETVEIVARLDAEGWRRSGIHDTFGRLDVAGLIREAVAHDEEHLGASSVEP